MAPRVKPLDRDSRTHPLTLPSPPLRGGEEGMGTRLSRGDTIEGVTEIIMRELDSR